VKNDYEVRGNVIAIEITLAGGKPGETLIDVADLPIAMKHPNRWWVNHRNYVKGSVQVNGRRQYVRLHRLILGVEDGVLVDHINRNPLDNRRSNLRIASPSLNGLNRGIQRNNTSGYRGVKLHKPSGRWIARIQIDGKFRYLGRFATPAEASIAYEVAYSERMDALTR
jgi:hypothetical protein